MNWKLFQSTLSLRRATLVDFGFGHPVDISIHALLAESDIIWIATDHTITISIHALLAESDRHVLRGKPVAILISIHALLAESDSDSYQLITKQYDFNPRSPCGERR